MKIVFWNINKNTNVDILEHLSVEIDPDIIILCEIEMPISIILEALNKYEVRYYYNEDQICKKIFVFSKFTNRIFKPVMSGRRYTVRSIDVPTYPKLNLMALHYQSKINWSNEDQLAHSYEIKEIINRFEEKTELKNTIVVGDFNMNPFEAGMVQTTGLHSVMSREIALKGSRIVDEINYDYFYNPMWSFFGDHGKGDVSGTIYSTLSKPINYFWNIFDQILIRPELLPYFQDEDLEILCKFGDKLTLVNDGKIVSSISDHLPIMFKINNY